jgi:uncharacterized protein (DUF952 family)
MIYHIAMASDWESQKNELEYVPTGYYREGFIHCCKDIQLEGVKERYFRGQSGMVLLHVDESKLKAVLKYEASTNDEEFPHVYGPINREAIIAVQFDF